MMWKTTFGYFLKEDDVKKNFSYRLVHYPVSSHHAKNYVKIFKNKKVMVKKA